MNLNYDVDFELLYGLIILIFIYMFKRNKIKNNKKIDNFIFFSYYLYIISLISVVFFPIPLYLLNEDQEFPFTFFLNVIPFKTILIVLERNPIQLFGNILLLLPLGVILPILKKKLFGIRYILIVGFLTSLTIESIQLLMSLSIGVPFRVFDIDDLICNTFGAILGYIIIKHTIPYIQKVKFNSDIINDISKS